MQANRSNVRALIGGAILIVFGFLSLAGQIFHSVNWGFLWPFIVIGIGALFFVAMFAGGKQAAAFAIPGSIVSGVGLVLLFQNITQHWESMSYFWTVILIFVGAGLYMMGWRNDDTRQKDAGLRVIKVGLILFIIFGAFFELLFSSFVPGGLRGIIFPILLILLGGYLIVTRSGLLGRQKADSASSDESPSPTN